MREIKKQQRRILPPIDLIKCNEVVIMAKVIIIEPDITEEENQRRWNIVKEILHEIDKEIVRENTEVNN